MSTRREIRLIEADSGRWSAVDVDTGAVGTGDTREAALSALDRRSDDAADRRPLGDRLAGMGGDLDVDPVDAVRRLRERT